MSLGDTEIESTGTAVIGDRTTSCMRFHHVVLTVVLKRILACSTHQYKVTQAGLLPPLSFPA